MIFLLVAAGLVASYVAYDLGRKMENKRWLSALEPYILSKVKAAKKGMTVSSRVKNKSNWGV